MSNRNGDISMAALFIFGFVIVGLGVWYHSAVYGMAGLAISATALIVTMLHKYQPKKQASLI